MSNQTESEPLYDVVIYEKATRKIDAVIGRDMQSMDSPSRGRFTAESRMMVGCERINDRFECDMVKAGTVKKGDVLP